MISRVDFTKDYWRYLYQPLYVAVRDFALQCGDSEEQVALRFGRLVAGDSSLGLLVEMSELKVESFFLYSLTPGIGFIDYCVAKPRKDSTFLQECLEYLESLPGVAKLVFTTSRHDYRAFERKYGFTLDRVIMSREAKPKQEEVSSMEDY